MRNGLHFLATYLVGVPAGLGAGIYIANAAGDSIVEVAITALAIVRTLAFGI